ncbi:MAG: amidohydrolase family protein, partial [Phycisphaerae bacterium]
VLPGHISWLKLAELLSTGAAKVMRITGRGTLAPGSVADVTIFNPEESWTIDPNKFKSKGRNTPFAGWQVKGRVKTTIVGGAVVYEE